MRLGTPLSPSATRVMLLGASEPGKEVRIALDRYADVPKPLQFVSNP
jgi:phosphoribosylglycinamide formyltransferase 2